MAALKNIRTVLAKRALYLQTKRELEALPADLAIEDLGLAPFDAKEIARRAVYG